VNISLDSTTEALIFDIDGTLLDTLSVHHQAWRETMLDYDIEVTPEFFDRVAGQTSAAIVAEIEREFDRSLPVETIVMAKDQAFVRHAPLIQPIRAVLEFAERYVGTLPLGAATNETFGIANIVLRTAGLMSMFQALVTVDEVAEPKPAPDLFVECARRLGVSAAHCHVFEDSDYGIRAAESAGMAVTDVRDHL
jgi:beta-phosphoglucomutase-like phosphatase (HAD superfamily)